MTDTNEKMGDAFISCESFVANLIAESDTAETLEEIKRIWEKLVISTFGEKWIRSGENVVIIEKLWQKESSRKFALLNHLVQELLPIMKAAENLEEAEVVWKTFIENPLGQMWFHSDGHAIHNTGLKLLEVFNSKKPRSGTS